MKPHPGKLFLLFLRLGMGAWSLSAFAGFGGSMSFRKAVKGVFAFFVGHLLCATVKFAFAVLWNAVRVLIVCTAFVAPHTCPK